MTKTVAGKICEGHEPIPGYVLEERIGRGGFGEVWRASAPGGLKKAVKFVFGEQDADRSQRERKSLERIRGVQHPFLLTLERFEAIDNQLVIVTELADCSLEDVYKKHCDSGSCGVPRETLLRHMHDTADALDYLHKQYQLQHLDIKPGNLLIIGGHVKVADFGLLKDLREAECSIVGGLTPVYAPPELFDGRPSMHSDQYSLAVMYQELLTGTRPFHGRTIAQLATQHVHGAPNIEPLPPRDRPVVARALEKDPERRFENCKAFVDALAHSLSANQRLYAGAGLDRGVASAAEFEHIGSVEDLPQLADSHVAFPSLEISSAQEFALVVALGGTGAECLRTLRRRAGEKHNDGRLELHSVLIDTDMATLGSIRDSEIDSSVGPCELIRTPLKTAREYRDSGTERLSTISRRWIYNVPRSVTTEGMRPLGRLALVDHGLDVTKQITNAIARMVHVSGGVTPRVYVVGSLTGGTSSGMYLDVVHLLRHFLDAAGLEDANILSMLTTTPMQADPGYPLALYDAHAALIEMNHFLNAGNGYPGDAGAQWPSVPAARTPLHQVYLIAQPTVGSLSPPPIETMADYVWSDSTGAGGLLASARQQNDQPRSSLSVPTIHSVGVVPLSDGIGMQEKVLSPAVVRELLVRWLGLPLAARAVAGPFRDQIVRRIGISPTTMVAAVAERLSQSEHLDRLSELTDSLPDRQRQDWNGLALALDSIIPSISEHDQFRVICSDAMKMFFGQVSVALTDGHADITTVIECMKLIRQANSDAARDLRTDSVGDWDPSENNAIHIAASQLIAANNLDHFNECLDFLGQRLEQFATTLAMGIVQAKKLQGVETNPWEMMPESLRSQFDSTVHHLHHSKVNQFLVRTLVDHATNIDAGAMVNQLHDVATQLVEKVTCEHKSSEQCNKPHSQSVAVGRSETLLIPSIRTSECVTATSIPDRVRADGALNGGVESLTVDQAVVAVKPSLLEFGGQQRLILIVGSEREREQFESQVREAHDGSVTVAVVPGSSPKLIHEARRIELSNVLTRLSMLNGGNDQVTGRLSSRSDITW